MTTPSAPATTVLDGNLYVFVRGTDDLIHFNRHVGGWEGWRSVPGGERTSSAPGVTAGVLVVRRADGGIRFNTFDGPTAWRGWADVPDKGRTPSAPAITDLFAGFFLFVRGLVDEIFYKSLGSDRVSWGAWKEVPGGGRTPSAPAIVKGLLLVRGTDDGLHHNSFTAHDSWTGWQKVPGGLTRSAPTIAHSPGYQTLVVRGTDDGIHYNFLA